MEISKFGNYLSRLRKQSGMTNKQLANRARVPSSLIAGLQSGKRRVGEIQANKIGVALELQGNQLDSFVLSAVNTCTEKILTEAKDYPSSFLNLIARQLRLAGILPSQLTNYQIKGDATKHEVRLLLDDGRIAQLSSTLSFA